VSDGCGIESFCNTVEHENEVKMSNSPTTLPLVGHTRSLDDVERRQSPTLITEQAVRFSTAVALSAPSLPQRTRGARVAAAMRRMFTASPEKPRRERRHEPRRYSFLEDALMGREMSRL
jgi:hypothetical protein